MTREYIVRAAVAMACLCSASPPRSLAADRPLVSLAIEERAGVARRGEPVTAGVPLPKGAFRDAAALALADERGRPVPAQFKPAARWWQDGSLKWVHVHFLSDVPANGRQTVRVVRGETRAPRNGTLRVADGEDRITVVAGALKFVVGKRKFNGIAEAWLDPSRTPRFGDGSRVIAPHTGGLVMRTGGREYRSANDGSAEVAVEESTPLYAVIRAKGVMSASDGARGFSYLCRLTAYAGQPRVTAQVTVVNTMGPRREDAVPLEMLAWEIPTAAKGPRILLGGEDRIHEASLRAGQSAWIYQRESDAYELGGVLEGSGKGKTPRTLGTGWASANGVAAGVRWFWQLYPKAVEVTGDGVLRLDLYPRLAKPLDIYTGVSRTHEVLLRFDRGTPAADTGRAFAAFQQPLRAFAPLRWYGRDTQAFGNLVEADPELFGGRREVLEKYIAWWTSNFENIKSVRDGRSINGVHRDAYGWLEFGDGFHHVWRAGNSDPRNLAWDGNYYDFPHACLLHYLLTGRADVFEFFIEHSRHLADVHFVHHDPDPALIGSNRYCPPTDHVRMDPPRGDYTKAEVYVSDTFNHHKTLSLFENYLLTGDRRSLDAALSGLRYAYEYTRADNAYSQPRGPGNQLLTLLEGYEFTGERKYLERCSRIIQFGREAQAKNGGAFAPQSGQYFQVGILLEALIRYHGITGDESVIPMMRAALDFFIARKSVYANCAYAAGFLHRKTGRSEYLDYALAALTRGGVFGNPVKETGLAFRSTPYALPYLLIPE